MQNTIREKQVHCRAIGGPHYFIIEIGDLGKESVPEPGGVRLQAHDPLPDGSHDKRAWTR